MTMHDHFSEIIVHFLNVMFWSIQWFEWFVLIWWLGSCQRSRHYVWPAATSATWGTSCSWARGFMMGSRATLPHRRSSTLTPPPPEDLTNQPSQSTSVLSASATRGKWWADENYKSTSERKRPNKSAVHGKISNETVLSTILKWY